MSADNREVARDEDRAVVDVQSPRHAPAQDRLAQSLLFYTQLIHSHRGGLSQDAKQIFLFVAKETRGEAVIHLTGIKKNNIFHWPKTQTKVEAKASNCQRKRYSMEETTVCCPYCREKIIDGAIVCKHCNSHLVDIKEFTKTMIILNNVLGTALFYGAGLGLIAGAIAEFTNIGGGIAAFAQPFSPIRNDIAWGYFLFGALFGTIGGSIHGYLISNKKIARARQKLAQSGSSGLKCEVNLPKQT